MTVHWRALHKWPAHGWKVVAHHDKRGRLRCAEADFHKSVGVVTLRRCGKELVKKS